MTIIRKSRFHALIFGSGLESAKRFKYKVTSKVLPRVRKHRPYITENVLEQTLNNLDFMIGLLT